MKMSRTTMITLIVIMIAGLWAHAPETQSDFIWDDDSYLVNNTLISRDDGLKRIWLKPTDSPQYYPMVFTMFRVEGALFGLNPLGYRWTNVLLHLASALLLWQLLKDLNWRHGAVAAVLFAVHPMTVESVAWITERKNVLSCFFMMLALLAMVRSMGWTKAPARRQDWVIGFICFGLGLLSKTTIVCAPIFIWLIGEVRGESRLKLAKALTPWFALGLVAGLHTASLERTHVGADQVDLTLSAGQHLILAARCYWHYLMTFIWPANLCFTPTRWNPELFRGVAWGVPAAFVLTLVAFRHSKSIWIVFLAVGAALFPALGLFKVYPMRFSWVADHFAYLALIPLCVSAAMLIGRTRWLVALLVIGCCLQSRRHGRNFVDATSLWTGTLATNPHSFLGLHNLGALRFQQSKQAEEPERTTKQKRAAQLIEQATLVDETDPLPHVVLGRIAREQKNRSKMLEHLQNALILNPDHRQVHLFTAQIADDDGELDAARKILVNLQARRPNDTRVMARLVNVYWKLKDYSQAEALLLDILNRRPNNWQAYGDPQWSRAAYELAWLRQRTGKGDVRGACALALELNPHNAKAQDMMDGFPPTRE